MFKNTQSQLYGLFALGVIFTIWSIWSDVRSGRARTPIGTEILRTQRPQLFWVTVILTNAFIVLVFAYVVFWSY